MAQKLINQLSAKSFRKQKNKDLLGWFILNLYDKQDKSIYTR